MTYIFPYRIPSTQPSSSRALTATSASVAEFVGIPVQTVLTASSVVTAGTKGPNGGTPDCSAVTPLPGPDGADGPTGDPGITPACPSGTVECPSISPSGSYGRFCVEIPPDCNDGVICPPDSFNPAQYVTPFPVVTPTMTMTPSTPSCLPLGSPCTSNGECCSNNCFDFECGPEL